MNKITKLFLAGAFSSALSVVPVSAGTVNFQTCFKPDKVIVQNEHNGYFGVYDKNSGEKLYSAKRDVEYLYSTTSLNIRKTPSVNGEVIQTVDIGTKLKRIGDAPCGWDIVKLSDGTKGFVWSKYLSSQNPVTPMGRFRVTYYCNCDSCSEGYGRLTSTGHTCYSDYTIAVDPSIIPYGTKVYMNGGEYLADDCGGAINGNEIDVYVDHHELTEKNGVDYYDVYIKR